MALGWGITSILQAATTNFAGLMALRCLLGVFEAGFAPGVALFLSFFYHRSEMAFRYGLFISFSPIANCFASAMAYGIVHARTSLSSWKLLFIIGQCYAFLLYVIENPQVSKSLIRGYTHSIDGAFGLYFSSQSTGSLSIS
jgi:MFS family permease